MPWPVERGRNPAKHVQEQKLRISRLPQQKIGKPAFARGADNEIGLRQGTGEQTAGEKFGRDGFRIKPAIAGGTGQFTGGGSNFLLRAIIESKSEIEALIAGRSLLRILDHAMDVAGDTAAVTDDADATALFDQLVHVAVEIAAEQAHQGADFGLGPLPVLG